MNVRLISVDFLTSGFSDKKRYRYFLNEILHSPSNKKYLT